jgi:hypothetical protein
MPLCPDCGALLADGSTCRAMFDALLAHEYAFPASFGAVHHLTVSAYYLQHPRGFSRAAIDGWRAIIAESLDELTPPAEFLRRARARSGASAKVREPGAEPPEGWPRSWPMTVADVVGPPGETPDASGHNDRVRRWAASIRATLEATAPR